MRVVALGEDGRAHCVQACGAPYRYPVQTALLDMCPAPGEWLLTHIDTAIRSLEESEALLIANALEALDKASRGEQFEHLLADLIDREPQLPAHLRAGVSD